MERWRELLKTQKGKNETETALFTIALVIQDELSGPLEFEMNGETYRIGMRDNWQTDYSPELYLEKLADAEFCLDSDQWYSVEEPETRTRICNFLKEER